MTSPSLWYESLHFYWMSIVVIYNILGAILLQFHPPTLEHLFPDSKKHITGTTKRILISWIWTFAAVRLGLVFDPYNWTLYVVTFFSFIMWLVWNYSEIVVAKTVEVKSFAFGIVMGVTSIFVLTTFYVFAPINKWR